MYLKTERIVHLLVIHCFTHVQPLVTLPSSYWHANIHFRHELLWLL